MKILSKKKYLELERYKKENTYLMIGKTKYIFELLDKINKAKEIYENRNSIKYKKKRFMEDKNTSDLMYEILKGDKDEK